MGSIPTRSRHLFPGQRAVTALATALALFLGRPHPTVAQDSAAVGVPDSATVAADTTPTLRDSLALRTSPMNAFWRSFLVPGWGQAKVGRKLTAGIFIAWEGTTIAMSLKTRRELAYLRRTNSARGEDKRREHEDWLVLLAFNHLFAGLEAYVSGHLTDFPPDLQLQALPGGVGASVSIPFRLR